jgi:hypothetical protein
MSEQEPEQSDCGSLTHYAGCACHEQGWQNRWKAAIDAAARAGIERDEARRDLDNALSDLRQADTDCIRAIHERNDAREKAKQLAMFAGDLLADVRVNAIYGTFAQATEDQIEAWVKERAERLASISQSG